MKRLIIALALLVLPLALLAGDFETASQAYAQGRYREAARLYERLAAREDVSADVYYNLGGCYYQLKDVGRALLNYERARLISPRDADLAYNLEAAKSLRRDNLPENQPWGGFSLNEALWSLTLVNLGLAAVLMLRLYRKPEWSAYVLIVALVLELCCGAGLAFKFWQALSDERAVILDSEVTALAGPQPGDTALFKLHAGSSVAIRASENGWSLIEAGSQQGWLAPGTWERIRRQNAKKTSPVATTALDQAD